MMKKSIFDMNLKNDTINTIQGIAKYWLTEIEDNNEKWNDDYNTSNGFYVIHRGNKHHVYKVI